MISEDRFGSGMVRIAPTPQQAGRAAGQIAAHVIRDATSRNGSAKVVFASAPSQEEMLRTLTSEEGIDWSKVESLHLDEYRGIAQDHPASFGQWLAERLPEAGRKGLRRISPSGMIDDEISRYTELLREGRIDLVCLGIGVNGHIAFNEPGDTSFEESAFMREVPLTEASRKQQVDEGLFASLSDVPTHALSMTVPAILAGGALVCTVLGEAKAQAVADALTGPITAEVPSSALRTHSNVSIFLDAGAAEKLPSDYPAERVE